MIWLTGHLLGVLALTAVLAGFAGWCWHAWRNADAAQALETEKARLRAELIRRARAGSHEADPDGQYADADDERIALRHNLHRSTERVAQLERELEAIHAENEAFEDLRAENAQLRAAGNACAPESADAEGLRARIVELEAALAQPANVPMGALEKPVVHAASSGSASGTDEALRWRAFYFERRAAYQAAEHAQALAAACSAHTIAEFDPEQEQITQWRLRYFSARAAYLEQRLAAREQADLAQSTPPDRAPEADNADAAEHARQQTWRLQYLDRRLESFAEQAREAVGAAESRAQALAAKLAAREREAEQVAARISNAQEEAFTYLTRAEAAEAEQQALRARVSEQDNEIGDLRRSLEEAQAQLGAVPKEDGEKTRLRWKTSYLEARVRQLEEHAFSAIAAAPAASIAQSPGPVSAPDLPAPRAREGAASASAQMAAASFAVRPKRLAAPRGGAPDDLRLIPGITPQIESKLNASGIFHFDQIADWTAQEASWVDQYLAMRGQIERDGWIGQAGRLARGEAALQRTVTSSS